MSTDVKKELEIQAPIGVRVVIPIISISWHGGTRIILQLANYLVTLGNEVVFLVARRRCVTPFEVSADVQIREIGVYTGLKVIDYLVFLCCVPFFVSRGAILLANFFVTYYPVRLSAWLRGSLYIYFVQDVESKYRWPIGALLNPICNATYRDKRIVTANGFLKERLMIRFGTASRSINIGPANIFYEMPRTQVKKYDFVYFLRKESWKGLDRFLRILQFARRRLTGLCVSQNLALSGCLDGFDADFLKPESDEELVKCIDSAHVLLMTSYKEGFALPPLEGMARGVPTVLFRCGGPDQYIVNGRNAVYVDTEEQAVCAIEHIVKNPEIYERMSREAVLAAAGYRMDKSMSEFAEMMMRCSDWG
jgi:glycosyltransferase involved in cell wall biosynthesis